MRVETRLTELALASRPSASAMAEASLGVALVRKLDADALSFDLARARQRWKVAAAVGLMEQEAEDVVCAR
eukprot:SAG25_NODE_3412_length_1091_cov_1.460685_2_plen_71_part_00